MYHGSKKGFTLAEVLITLAILAVISAMLIPKVLTSGTDNATKAVVQDIYANTGGLFQKYQAANPNLNWNSATFVAEFTNYMDQHINAASCGAGCYQFPTGARISNIRKSTIPTSSGQNRPALLFTASASKIERPFTIVVVADAATSGAIGVGTYNAKASRTSSLYGVTGQPNHANKPVETILNTATDAELSIMPDTPAYAGGNVDSSGNSCHTYDVNCDGQVNDTDGQSVINAINAGASPTGPYANYDTNGNGTISAIDALGIINCMNNPAASCPDAPF